MTYIEFRKCLVDLDLSIAKFCKLIKVSDKNITAYKNKESIPNTIATIAICFVEMKKSNIDYTSLIENLNLSQKKKEGAGFSSKKKD